ncbi:hypothetical protein WJX81_005537 [Elliptochloris bilobata]|uniref:Thioredoxin domain-containing protein n=1 Tax=Elliptochloris bilobata TaxID=381761 RepID=A0AAW1RID7_9CHLO
MVVFTRDGQPQAQAAPAGGQQPEHAAGRVTYARTDDELRDRLAASRDGLAVVEYGSSWCAHCQEMFPHFYRLSAQHPAHQFIVAQLDFLEAGARGVRFTPTFAFWRMGRKVDQFWGSDSRQLRDRMWLHAEDDGPRACRDQRAGGEE